MSCEVFNSGLGVKRIRLKCDICGFVKNYAYTKDEFREVCNLIESHGWITNGYNSYIVPTCGGEYCACKKKACVKEFKEKFKTQEKAVCDRIGE